METVYDGYISKYVNRRASEPMIRLKFLEEWKDDKGEEVICRNNMDENNGLTCREFCAIRVLSVHWVIV